MQRVRLAISSNSEGPTSKVEVVGGSARTLLGFNGGSAGVGTATFVTTVTTDRQPRTVEGRWSRKGRS